MLITFESVVLHERSRIVAVAQRVSVRIELTEYDKAGESDLYGLLDEIVLNQGILCRHEYQRDVAAVDDVVAQYLRIV
jgi:hypothetical protein